MKRLTGTLLTVIFGYWQTNAQAVVLQAPKSPLEIMSMQKALVSEKLPGGIELVADLIMDEPVGDPIDDPVDDPISVRVNTGYCQSDPPKWKYVKEQGLFYYEFCDYPLIDNNLKMDVHRKPGSGGAIGAITNKQYVECSTYYPGTSFLPPDVVTDFCND